jgi:hypothetical protein
LKLLVCGIFGVWQTLVDLPQRNGLRFKSSTAASLTSDFFVTEFEETFALAILAFHFWFARSLFHVFLRRLFFPQQSRWCLPPAEQRGNLISIPAHLGE